MKKLNSKFQCGKSYAFTGKSGYGKSTLLNTIARLERAGEQYVYFNGQLERFKSNLYRDKSGYSFQNYGLTDNLAVNEDLDIELVYKRVSKKGKEQIETRYIGQLGLLNSLRRRVHALSGGEQQCIALVRMMSKDPVVMLADEPADTLDPKTGQMIIQSLFDLVDENKALTLVTHDMVIANRRDEIIDLERYRKVASM